MNRRTKLALSVFVSALLAANAFGAVKVWVEIPHVAIGGGYSSYLYVSDAQGAARQVRAWFYTDDGAPLSVNVEGIGQVSDFTFSLSPLQERAFALTGGATTQGGWAELESDGVGRLNATLRFAVSDGSGTVTDAVGIMPAEPSYNWTVTVDTRKSTEYVGVATANPWTNTTVDVFFDLYQGASKVAGTATVKVSLKPLGHYAGFVHQLFPNFRNVGTLRMSSSSRFVAVALRGDGTQYSALPADQSTQLWTWTYTNASGTTYNGTWSWRFLNGFSFFGQEQNPWNDYGVDMRGLLTSTYFILEWWWSDSSNGTNGTFLFQGKPVKEADKDVINGKLSSVKQDGTLEYSYTFKATRVY